MGSFPFAGRTTPLPFCVDFDEFEILRNGRKYIEIFVIFSEFVLDKQKKEWYHNRARVGGICGFFRNAHCDDAGDCVERR